MNTATRYIKVTSSARFGPERNTDVYGKGQANNNKRHSL
jgi:hypothetical protein